MPRGKADKSTITEKQQQVLNFIEKQLSEKGYPPSVREICAAVGFKSTSSAHAYLAALESKGLLQKDGSKTRALKVTSSSQSNSSSNNTNNILYPEFNKEIAYVPIIGQVTAGAPILAVESVEDVFPLSVEFLGNSDVFILKVKGESMIEAGILDGDFVIISKQSTARNGEIVVALIEDEATVKTFYKENGYFRLQPENSSMEPIIVKEASILGKVIGLYRKIL